jgi:single-stranded DNA-binding protein
MKGQQVAVTGELGTREWTDDSGETKTQLTCRVNDVTLIGKRDDSGGQQPAPQQQSRQKAPQSAPQQQAASGAFDDDIPFAPYMREFV